VIRRRDGATRIERADGHGVEIVEGAPAAPLWGAPP
jgi:hypothetical protein